MALPLNSNRSRLLPGPFPIRLPGGLLLLLLLFTGLADAAGTELRLSFRHAEAGAYSLTMRSPDMDVDSDARPFDNPLAAPEQQARLDNLRWYLEQYWRWPVGPDRDRARRAEADMRVIGKRLFEALFPTPGAMAFSYTTRSKNRSRSANHLISRENYRSENLEENS